MTESPIRRHGVVGALLSLLNSIWFKIAVAVAIVSLLVHFNRLDLGTLTALRETWPWLAVAFVLMLPPFAIVSYRFKLILRSQRVDVPMSTAVRWTMIGGLFDLVMPSSNGGDVIKAGFVMNHVGAGTRVRAVMAVAIDRVLGMLGLLFLAGIISMLNWRIVAGMPGGTFLLLISFGATIGVLAAFRMLGARWLYHHPWLNQRLEHSDWGRRVKHFIGAFNELRERPAYLLAAIGLSVFNHIFWCIALLCISRAVGHQVSLVEGFAVFPLAILGNVFGVAGGFGVGTAAFDLILSQLLEIGNGALIGLLFQTLSGVAKLSGLPFYLASHSPVTKNNCGQIGRPSGRDGEAAAALPPESS
jgi:uncharacterized protein (TIRG00374 family)